MGRVRRLLDNEPSCEPHALHCRAAIHCGRTWAKVKVCNEKRHEPDEEVSEDAWMQAFTVTPHHRGYVVKRNSDGTAASSPFAERIDAVFAARDLYRR
jgi:hypothetical protein